MTYPEWIARHDTLTPEQRAALRQEFFALREPLLISVVMPVYNPDLRFLEEAIESVRAQIYPRWELCIADDCSTDHRAKKFLEAAAHGEPRLKIVFREKNGGISACSNSALALARGEWIALLDQDDLLAENALSEIAREIARNPDAGLIFSDEDFIDGSGARTNPFFKPDWNPELFLAQNYLNHLSCYRAALLHEIGGFREGFEGSQDYDLALRCSARLAPGQIRHIPRLLYHWRMIAGSLADQPDAKPHARHAARRALDSHLRERGLAAWAEACPENAESHRIVYDLPSPAPRVTILASAGVEASSVQTNYPALEWTRLESSAAGAMNKAARKSRGDIFIFLNATTSALDPAWLEEMVSVIVRPEVGAVGARLWSPAGTLVDGGLILGLGGIATPAFYGIPHGHPGYFNRAWLQQNYLAVSAACMAVRKEVFFALNGFDEKNFPHQFYDIDFCLRLHARKLQVVWTPYGNLIACGEGLRDEATAPDEAACLRERWAAQFQRDPFYNPNLSLERPGFLLAPQPRTERMP